MRDLLRDIPEWKVEDAAAAVGNAGHESNGLTSLQEIKPTIDGSRGGWGWLQWTGPRRRAFENWAKSRGFKFDSYEANYGFMVVELRGPESATIGKVKFAKGLRAKVIAFELGYERAGVKHYDSRAQWAARALAAYNADENGVPANPKPLTKSRTAAGGALAGAGGAVVVAKEAKDTLTETKDSIDGTIIGLVLGAVILIGAIIAIYARWDDAGRPMPKWLKKSEAS